MCKAFVSNPPLLDDKTQTEAGEPQPKAGEVPVLEESSQKRKGKEIPVEEPKKKKKKPSGPLPKASGGPKVGGQATPRQHPHAEVLGWLLQLPSQLLRQSQGLGCCLARLRQCCHRPGRPLSQPK